MSHLGTVRKKKEGLRLFQLGAATTGQGVPGRTLRDHLSRSPAPPATPHYGSLPHGWAGLPGTPGGQLLHMSAPAGNAISQTPGDSAIGALCAGTAPVGARSPGANDSGHFHKETWSVTFLSTAVQSWIWAVADIFRVKLVQAVLLDRVDVGARRFDRAKDRLLVRYEAAHHIRGREIPLVMTKHFALFVVTASISARRWRMRLSFIRIGQPRDAASAIHSVSATSSSRGMP